MAELHDEGLFGLMHDEDGAEGDDPEGDHDHAEDGQDGAGHG